MLKKLRLERFKNFKEAELVLGPLTLLVGTNASGKSNIRDAFRFLHGISRGYTLAEIIGEKWIEGGVLQWKGIRGGTREATFQGVSTFALEVSFTIKGDASERDATYRIEIDVGVNGKAPRVVAERLVVEGRGDFVFDSHPETNPPPQDDLVHLNVRVRRKPVRGPLPSLSFLSQRPVLSQLPDYKHKDVQPAVQEIAQQAIDAFSSMRFLDLSPEALRLSSLPGQTILGDRGENLSSVLQAICESSTGKDALIQWIKELTPMDAKDFEFPADPAGKILVTLVEGNSQKTSAYSASDGTLRFLAMIAALLGPEPARFYFFEELENGIHPTRLHLLLQLIEQRVSRGTIQMVATTHSPHLLGLISPTTLKHASLTYRLENKPDARIRRILDIPEARSVIEKQDLTRLHASGWLEDAVAFVENEEAAA
ncbi:MAG: AAA family ATPase [Deltaproteobacteria bacterium]|nr:AAA family ATPase [Deltaproteobacteria bacterium]